MENLVFIEILRRGYSINREVFYYKTSNETEVDFVLRKGIGFEKLIRVCYEIENIEIRERKLKGLAKAAGELNCNTLMVITWDYEAEEEFKGKKVSFIPLWKWLLS